MNPLRSLCILLFVLAALCSKAQVKMEIEKRVNMLEVPDSAIIFIHLAAPKTSPKWFREGGLIPLSYEAKFKLDSKRYSIEFDTAGMVQDVEILITKKQLPISTKRELIVQLERESDNYKITRIQEQYSGSRAVLLQVVQYPNAKVLVTKRFEVEVKIKKDKKWRLYEWTIDESGKLISEKRIIQPTTDHLVY